jgi:hypothetical protein
MEMDIEVICSWCSKFLGTKKFFSDDMMNKSRVSHSICSKCRDQLLNEYKKALRTRNRKSH